MGVLLNKMDLNTSNPEEYETNGYTTQHLGQNIYLSQNFYKALELTNMMPLDCI